MGPLPTLSLIIPVYNDAANLLRCLMSIEDQTYPKDRFEVLIADGGSTDRSRVVAESFMQRLHLRILDNSERREAEWGKAIALQESQGELFQCIDADMWPTTPNMLETLAMPLALNQDLAGAIAPYTFAPSLSVWSRFLTLDAFQRDPLLQRLTSDIEDFFETTEETHILCRFSSPRIPPIGGTTMFRLRDLELGQWGGHYREVDHPAHLVKKGRILFAFVPQVGWAHDHCRTLADLVSKRRRNLRGLSTSFLHQPLRDYVWWPRHDWRQTLLLARWILGTNLVLPRALEGVVEALRKKRWEGLLRPVVALAVTDALLIDLLFSEAGRAFLRPMLRWTVSRGD